jgi:cold shock CspA family protein
MSAWKAGKVHFWDEEKGSGMILDTKDGDFFFIHYSAIDSKSNVKNLAQNQEVKFKTYKNAYSEKVQKLKILKDEA